MLSYWKQFHANSHLAGLGLIDMTAYPMSDGDWNSHSLRNHNAEGFNAFAAALLGNPKALWMALPLRCSKTKSSLPGKSGLRRNV